MIKRFDKVQKDIYNYFYKIVEENVHIWTRILMCLIFVKPTNNFPFPIRNKSAEVAALQGI